MASSPTPDKRIELLKSHTNSLPCATRLGDKLQASLPHVIKLHEKEWPADGASQEVQQEVLGKCVQTLDLLADVHDVMCAATRIYRVFLAQEVVLTSGGTEERFRLNGLDGEGRPTYKGESTYLRWYKGKQGGKWAARTDAEGKEPGDLQLDSPVPIDPGVWIRVADGQPDEEVRCVRGDAPVLTLQAKQEIDMCWPPGGNVDLPGLERALKNSGLGNVATHAGTTVLAEMHNMVQAMCGVAEKIGLGAAEPPRFPNWNHVFRSMSSLAQLCDEPLWKTLSEKIPFFTADSEVSFVQCMVCTCRLLDICDFRLSEETWLLRLCHRFFFQSWLQEHRAMACVVDPRARTAAVGSPPPRTAGALRCVVISDTHGWDGELSVPPGDVLLHCGDVLFEGASLGPGDAVPEDLKAVLQVFHRPEYQAFKRIFMIGGNHDKSLHELWARRPERLRALLPKNMVLLQAPAKLTPPLSSTALANDPLAERVVEEGAMKLLPGFGLARPRDPRPGWVIAGSGVSLANSTWTANNAFQLVKDDHGALQEAADQLLRHSPDVILTHGPPKGHGDSKRGDAKLGEAVERSRTVRVHAFGHVHETYGADFGDNGVAYVNASMSTPLYVPSREPIMFDLPLKEPTCPPDPGRPLHAAPQPLYLEASPRPQHEEECQPMGARCTRFAKVPLTLSLIWFVLFCIILGLLLRDDATRSAPVAAASFRQRGPQGNLRGPEEGLQGHLA